MCFLFHVWEVNRVAIHVEMTHQHSGPYLKKNIAFAFFTYGTVLSFMWTYKKTLSARDILGYYRLASSLRLFTVCEFLFTFYTVLTYAINTVIGVSLRRIAVSPVSCCDLVIMFRSMLASLSVFCRFISFWFRSW